MTDTTTKHPREVDDVLLRVPTVLRAAVKEQAKENGLSQNAFMTNSILFGALVYGERQYLGKPQNIVFLVEEIDRAHASDDATIGAFNSKDWAEIENIVKMLEGSDVLSNLKTRPDSKAPGSIVFSFTLTKNGRTNWPHLRMALLMLAQSAEGKEPLPMI